MSRWARTKLSEITSSIDYGHTAPSTTEAVGPKFLRITDIQDGCVDWETVPFCECSATEEIASQLQTGDIVFARTGATTGKSFLIKDCPDRAVFASYLIRVRAKSTVTPDYLAHFFGTPDYWSQISLNARGAAQLGVNATSLKSLSIPLPPIAEQKRIAAILDQAESLRTLRRQTLAQLDALTQSLFLEMFGDPISNTNNLPLVTLEDFLVFRTGKLDSNAATPTGKYPFFTCSREDFRIDEYAFDCEALLLAGNNASADYSVKYYKGKFNAYQRTYVITLKNEDNSYAFARFVLEYRLGELKRISKGTNTKYLTLELLNRIQIPLPPLPLQQEFARRVEAIEELKATHRASLAHLDALFVSLQHRAFRGEL